MGQRSIKEKEWLEILRIFGISKEDGKRIIGKLGYTLINEHEKLFGSYCRYTFRPSSTYSSYWGKTYRFVSPIPLRKDSGKGYCGVPPVILYIYSECIYRYVSESIAPTHKMQKLKKIEANKDASCGAQARTTCRLPRQGVTRRRARSTQTQARGTGCQQQKIGGGCE